MENISQDLINFMSISDASISEQAMYISDKINFDKKYLGVLNLIAPLLFENSDIDAQEIKEKLIYTNGIENCIKYFTNLIVFKREFTKETHLNIRVLPIFEILSKVERLIDNESLARA